MTNTLTCFDECLIEIRKIKTIDRDYLAMNEGCDRHIPGSVGSHTKSKERPNPIVVEGRYEYCGSTTSPKYVCPCPLVQMIIYVVYITATQIMPTQIYKAMK